MTPRVVLDAAAFDDLGSTGGTALRAVLEVFTRDGADTWVAAVTLAEVCRGRARTQQVEAMLKRPIAGRQIRVVPTDERLAKLVGVILHDSGSGSEFMADAHVVAVCAGSETALAVTGDPDDITRLAGAVPGTRIVTHRPWSAHA